MSTIWEKLIDEEWLLQREKKSWIWENPGQQQKISFRCPSRKSVGFSLDKNGIRAWPFLHPASSLPGISRRCDAFILLKDQKSDYYGFPIEIKTNDEGAAKEQLANGIFFCQWIWKLLRHHGHVDKPIKVICLLCRHKRQLEKDLTYGKAPPEIEGCPLLRYENCSAYPEIDLQKAITCYRKRWQNYAP